ncbi:MAG: hypothetical protein WC050_01080 [Candidatus Paceibacterota bacterium]
MTKFAMLLGATAGPASAPKTHGLARKKIAIGSLLVDTGHNHLKKAVVG